MEKEDEEEEKKKNFIYTRIFRVVVKLNLSVFDTHMTQLKT